MRMLYWLCDGEAFSPRWVCGAFEGGLGWVSIATSLLLALAYLGMCGLMSRQIRRAVAASLLRQEVAQQLALQKPSVPCPVQTQAWAEAASNSLDQALSTLRGQV